MFSFRVSFCFAVPSPSWNVSEVCPNHCFCNVYLQKVKSADAALAKSLSAGVKLGGPAAETDASNPRVVFKTQHVALSGTLSASSAADATAIDFGAAMKSKFKQFTCPGGKKAVGGKSLMKNYKTGGPFAGKTNNLGGTINNEKVNQAFNKDLQSGRPKGTPPPAWLSYFLA